MADAKQSITVAAGQITARLMNEADETLLSLEKAIDQAAADRADLLVLPECAYPAYLLGSVRSYRVGDHMTGEAFVGWLSERAARHHMHIISGYVDDVTEKLYNAAIFIDDRGRRIGRARKRFLWQADHEWFTPGNEIQTFDSDLGKIGIIICAETRVPEIMATMVAGGAELMAMPTCWINAAGTPGQYKNIQVEFLIAARAAEFGVPFVCADKSGLELGAVGYVGQSRIVLADGALAAEAPPTGDAVVTAKLDLHKPPPVRMDHDQRARLLDDAEPIRPPDDPPIPITVTAVPNKSRDKQSIECTDVTGKRVVTEPRQAGCLSGEEIASFAPARCLTLQGARLLRVVDMPDEIAILRTRAAENCVFVVGANERSAIIIGPDGTVLAQTGPAEPAPAVANIDLAAAANKLVAPKTDIFSERRPELYRF